MNTLQIFIAGLAVAAFTSCGLVKSVLKIPAGVIKPIGRTMGISSVSDIPELPVTKSASNIDREKNRARSKIAEKRFSSTKKCDLALAESHLVVE